MPAAATALLRFRLLIGNDYAIGPGKTDLLEAIARAGSISAAARDMRMSYKRAWQLVDELNHTFNTPLVEANKGGSRGGGARLTAAGTEVLAAYRSIERKAQALLARDLARLARLKRLA